MTKFKNEDVVAIMHDKHTDTINAISEIVGDMRHDLHNWLFEELEKQKKQLNRMESVLRDLKGADTFTTTDIDRIATPPPYLGTENKWVITPSEKAEALKYQEQRRQRPDATQDYKDFFDGMITASEEGKMSARQYEMFQKNLEYGRTANGNKTALPTPFTLSPLDRSRLETILADQTRVALEKGKDVSDFLPNMLGMDSLTEKQYAVCQKTINDNSKRLNLV